MIDSVIIPYKQNDPPIYKRVQKIKFCWRRQNGKCLLGFHPFLMGNQVKGGHYGEYPSLDPAKLLEGDLKFNNDFRGLYTDLLEDWLNVEARPIVKGIYEKILPFAP